MLALSDRIVADGKVPWCLGLESGDSTGWVGSDWIEDIMLRTAGAKVYDRWISHQIPFNDSRVKTAFEEFGKIARNDKYVVGGKVGVISTPFGDSPAPLFDRPPGCYLHRQANFIASFLPSRVKLGEDVGLYQCRRSLLLHSSNFSGFGTIYWWRWSIWAEPQMLLL